MDLSPPDRPRVRIVLPAYNEQRSLAGSLKRMHSFCQRELTPYDWHLLIANNGSTDSTASIAETLSATYEKVSVIHLPEAGRGGALIEAAALPGADYLLYTDVDLSADLTAVPRLLSALDNGAALVVGTRLHPDSRIQRRLHRDLLSRAYNLLLHTILGVRLFNDAQCGLKAFNLRRLGPVLDRVRDRKWFFDTELLTLAEHTGHDIVEIPVNWTDDPDSRVHIPSTIVQYILGMIRLKLHK